MRAADLIAALPERREEFEATGDWAEELRTLPPNTVETLWGLGMFGLKSPAELGGSPLDPLSFCDVIEELACLNTSVAWAAVIGAGCDGVAGGWLPRGGRPQGVRGRPSVPCGRGATVAARHRHSCGLRVPRTGHWGFSSGILHADWLIGMFATDASSSPLGQGASPRRLVVFVIPKEQAEVIDNCHVAGL
jgi:alkylation response protein AidB-like acyl-CoA dehydrogenase